MTGRVLVVDDEEVVRELIVEILERAGHDVAQAAVPAEALSLVEQDVFDVVVTDMVMPGLTGLEVLERMKVVRPSLPVVLVTGQGTQDNVDRAVELGAAVVILKPFTHAELREAVATALRS